VKFVWILIAFTAGAVVEWIATGKFSSDWVGATGTWVGALATIATISWAVRSFQIEKQDRVDERDNNEADELRAEHAKAMEFIVRVRGGGGYGPDGDKTMGNINVEILNGTRGSVTFEDLKLPDVTLKNATAALSLPLVVPPQQEPNVPYRQVDIEPLKVPDDQFSGRPFTLRSRSFGRLRSSSRRTDLESTAHAVIGLCNSWGGSAMPLIPVTPHTPIDSRWHRILLQSSIDGIAKTDLLDEGQRAKYRDIHGGDYRQLLLRILVDLDTPKPTVQTCRGVPTDDKWYLAYLALFGDLPVNPDPMNSWNGLPRSRFDLPGRRERVQGVEAESGAAGLAALIRESPRSRADARAVRSRRRSPPVPA
jgi:hypothetical protein